MRPSLNESIGKSLVTTGTHMDSGLGHALVDPVERQLAEILYVGRVLYSIHQSREAAVRGQSAGHRKFHVVATDEGFGQLNKQFRSLHVLEIRNPKYLQGTLRPCRQPRRYRLEISHDRIRRSTNSLLEKPPLPATLSNDVACMPHSPQAQRVFGHIK